MHFVNQLLDRELYDVIFITTNLNYEFDQLYNLFGNGKCSIVHTYEDELFSDNFGFFARIMFSVIGKNNIQLITNK